MEEDEIMACMSLKKWNEFQKKWDEMVEIVGRLAEVNGVDFHSTF